MRHLALALGLALLLLSVSSASFAQTAPGTQPGGTTPPAGAVTSPGAGSPEQMPPSTKAKGKQTAQQAKKKSCAHEADTQGLKGNERKQFMHSCLKK